MNRITGENLAVTQQYGTQLAGSPDTSDYQLAQEAALGEPTAIGHLYERHRPRVHALCLRMTRNGPEAEDLTQEVFVHLFKKIGSFRGESQFTSWLHRLTVNLVLMHFRHKATRREKSAHDIEATVLIPEKEKQASGGQAVSGQAVDRLALYAALDHLPAGSRSVFELFDIEGYQHREIANLLGCSVGTSKSQLHKARRKLRRLLMTGRSKVALVPSELPAIPDA